MRAGKKTAILQTLAGAIHTDPRKALIAADARGLTVYQIRATLDVLGTVEPSVVPIPAPVIAPVATTTPAKAP